MLREEKSKTETCKNGSILAGFVKRASGIALNIQAKILR
jgi:hypothetical protein